MLKSVKVHVNICVIKNKAIHLYQQKETIMKTLHKKRLYKMFVIENKKNTLTYQRAIYDRNRK